MAIFEQVSPPDAPPKRGRPVGSTNAPKGGAVDLIPFDKLGPAIESQYNGIAAFMLPFYPATAYQVTEDAETIANTYVDVAKRSPQFHRALSKMINSAGMLTIIAVHANIAMSAFAESRVPKADRMERAININTPPTVVDADAA